MKLNELKNIVGSKKNKKRRGRGIGSGLGKTSGKGVKGQKARSGVSIKGFEGGQTSIVKRLPKRGFNAFQPKKYTIISFKNISRLVLSKSISDDELIDIELLKRLKIIKNNKKPIKLLSNGKLDLKLNFKLDSYSKKAKEIILNNGGKIF